jgi:sugar phosphate permease
LFHALIFSQGYAKGVTTVLAPVPTLLFPIAYSGAANAGVPLAFVVEKYGWNAYFAVLMACCGVVLVLMLPMMNLKSYSQQEALKAA